ncbi:MAG: stage III sporulation protein AE [Oscillospiraceae bacterium]|nr:stage III sporulation protein AE [Oscillospiraceae bacterium]
MQRSISWLLTIILSAVVFFSAGITAHAEAPAEYDYGRDRLAEAVPPEAAEALDEAEITPDNGGAASLSIEGVLSYLWGLVINNAAAPLRLFISLCGIILLCAISSAAADNGSERLSGLFSTVGVLAGAGMTVAALSDILDRTLELLSAASVFITAFIPVFAGILAVMGRSATASAVNTVTLAATQLFSQLAVNFLAPLSGAIMGLSIAGAVHPELNLSKLGEAIKKIVVWILGFLMTIFMSILSVQTAVTGSADSVLIKTAKFAVSSGVPIVGGTISDAVSTMHGSLSIIRSSVGTYGMTAAAVIILPTLVTVICYRAAVICAEVVSDIFGVKELSSLLKSCGAVMSIMMAVIVCFLLLNTIAVVIMLAIGSGTA